MYSPYDYAVIRFVPRVDREEFINVGVVLFCRVRKVLKARVQCDPNRIAAIAPNADLEIFDQSLRHFVAVADGATEAGPIAALPLHERFHWLVAPRSTILQVSAVHSGLTDDPMKTLDQLFTKLVE